MNLGGFTGVTQKYTYGRLYNLYLDPEGDAQLHDPQARLHRQLHQRHRDHFRTYGKYPPSSPSPR